MIAINLNTLTITYSTQFKDNRARYQATKILWKKAGILHHYLFPVKAHDEEDTTVTDFTIITNLFPKNGWEIVL